MSSRIFADRWKWICLVLIATGFSASVFLLGRSFALLTNRASDLFDVCRLVFGTDCDTILLSGVSLQLGIPLAGWGIVFYATIACLMALGWVLHESFAQEAILGALVVATIGACVSVFLATIQFTGQQSACPLCLTVHIVNLLMVPALKQLGGRTIYQQIELLRVGIKYLLGEKTDSPEQAAWKVVGFVTAALVAVVAYQWVFLELTLRKSSVKSVSSIIAEYISTPRQEIPVYVIDPRLGPAYAPVELVVFSSFRCPGCRIFAKEIHQLADRYPKDVKVIFKNFPLDQSCNSKVKVDMQPGACDAAVAAVAAHDQEKFWPFHDALFTAELNATEATILLVARNVDLDLKQFQLDRQTEPTKAKVKSDIELGLRLGVAATPTVFLNGKRVRHLSTKMIQVLIHHELGVLGK